jgi:hypothetical protein
VEVILLYAQFYIYVIIDSDYFDRVDKQVLLEKHSCVYLIINSANCESFKSETQSNIDDSIFEMSKLIFLTWIHYRH